MTDEVKLGPQIWRPSWIKSDPIPAFGWRVPTVTERELFEGEMAVHNALAVYPWDIAEQFRAGLAALIPEEPEEAERLDGYRDRQVTGSAPLTPAEQADLTGATAALMKFWPGYSELVGQAARREAVLPIVAFRQFVTGWENVTDTKNAPITLQRGLNGMITEASLTDIESMMIRGCGAAIYRAMYPGGLEKNSEQPSSSGGDPATMPGATTKAGSSEPKNGKKTRSKRSRARSSASSISG